MAKGKARPDFLFPCAAADHDASFPAEYLTMLAAKSSSKDRWGQVLVEGNRVLKAALREAAAGC